MKRVYSSEAKRLQRAKQPTSQVTQTSKRPQCQVCRETFDTLLFAVNVRQGKAHPLCAALKAIGLEKLAITSGR